MLSFGGWRVQRDENVGRNMKNFIAVNTILCRKPENHVFKWVHSIFDNRLRRVIATVPKQEDSMK